MVEEIPQNSCGALFPLWSLQKKYMGSSWVVASHCSRYNGNHSDNNDNGHDINSNSTNKINSNNRNNNNSTTNNQNYNKK